MAIRFTPSQKKAIETSGRNLLVSAGAGSGKTAVLTERVNAKLEAGVPIESLVILTFTNKAAMEMKERIRDNIVKKAAQDPALKKALEGLDSAHIRTFDSFCLFLLKKYGYLQNLSRDLHVADEALQTILKEEIADEILAEAFKEKEAEFLDYVSTFANKDDSALQRQLVFFHDALSIHPDREELVSSLGPDSFTEERFAALFSMYEEQAIDLVRLLVEKLERMEEERLSEESVRFCADVRASLQDLLEAFDYETIHTLLRGDLKLPSRQGISQKLKDTPHEGEIDILKQHMDDLRALLQDVKEWTKKDKTEHRRAFFATKDHTAVLTRLLSRFDERHMERQLEEESFDYATIVRLVMAILEENPDVLSALKERIHEIMVDEYQDTNAMQEALLSLLTSDNLYMVGDVKQSIYRFRDADPSIFSAKYHDYRLKKGGLAISLNENFRSRKVLLESVNKVFSALMDERIGGIDYDADQSLQAGNESYLRLADENSRYGLDLAIYDLQDHKEFFEENDRAVAEIIFLAQDIQQRIEAEEKVVEDDSLRPVRYGDFAILTETATRYDDFLAVFEHLGIPLSVHKNPSFIAHEEVAVLKQALTLALSLRDENVYADKFRHAFMSVTRSFLFDFSDETIASQYALFPDHLLKEETFKERHVQEPFRDFFQSFFDLAGKIPIQPLPEAIHDVLEALSFYRRLVRIENTEAAKNRLDHLLAVAYERADKGDDIQDFIAYFDALQEAGLDKEFFIQKPFSPDKVHLLTMHKSKGLQFSNVYIPHTYRRFRFSSLRNFEFDRELGFLIPHLFEGLDKFLAFDLKRTKEREAEVSERLRLLYVAMTRAKENLTVIAGNDPEKDVPFARDASGRIERFTRRNFNSFSDIFQAVKSDVAGCIRRVDFEHIGVVPSLERPRRGLPALDSAKKAYAPFLEAKEEITQRKPSEGVRELLDERRLSALEEGERIHGLFEDIDFTADADKEIDQLAHDADTKKHLETFLRHPLLSTLRIKRAFKEYPLHLADDSQETSGYVDLLLETEEGYVIIDYKLENIDKEAYDEQVNRYADILEGMLGERPKGYLYSILEGRFREIGT